MNAITTMAGVASPAPVRTLQRCSLRLLLWGAAPLHRAAISRHVKTSDAEGKENIVF
jgi:hypothetical protein